jgi:hypothetical protein
MATARSFAYNPGATGPIPGTEQVGALAVGTPTAGFASTGLPWWNGPDEDLGYVIAASVPGNTQPTQVPDDAITLSTIYKGTDIALSNNNQTANQIFSYAQTVLGQTIISGTDKVMFSVQYTSTNPSVGVGGHFIGVGLTGMNYSGPFNGYPGNDTNSIGFSDGGSYFYNGASVQSGLPTWTSGDIIDIAISSGQSWWIRVNGGNWNNNPAANPTTGANGSVLSGLSNFYPALCPYIYGTMGILNYPKYGVPTDYNFLGNVSASVGFFRSSALTDPSFISIANYVAGPSGGGPFASGSAAKTWLNANGYWTSYGELPGGMVLYLDSGVSASYPGTGTTWYDISGYGNDGTLHGVTYSGGTAAAFTFNGTSSDYVDFASVNSIPIGNQPYTVSVWFNSNEIPSSRGFIGWGNFGTTNQVNAWRLLNSGGNPGFVHFWW